MMNTDQALQAKNEAESQCIQALAQLMKQINCWPQGRRQIANVIAECNGWGTDEADETYIQPALDALESYNRAHENLLGTLANA